MFLHLQAASKTKAANYVQYGMIMQITLLSLIRELNTAFMNQAWTTQRLYTYIDLLILLDLS